MHTLKINTLLKKNWDLVHGSKWAILAPLLLFTLISISIGFIFNFAATLFGWPVFRGSFTTGFSIGYITVAFMIEIITIFITAPLIAGAQMVALKRVRNEAIHPKMGFLCWRRWLDLGLTLTIVYLGVGLINVIFGTLIMLGFKVGFWLAIIFQISTVVAFILYYAFFIFAVLFVIDKENSPIEALVSCYEMVKPYWLPISTVILSIAIGLLIVFLPYFLLSMTGYFLLSLLGSIFSIGLAVWAISWFHLIISDIFHELNDTKTPFVQDKNK